MTHWIESFDYRWNGIPLSVDCLVDEVRSAKGRDWEIEVDDVLCGDSRVEFNEIEHDGRPLADWLEEICRERLKTEPPESINDELDSARSEVAA